ncbi:MAG: recombinase XerD, partial [Sphingomonadales bacterium]
MMRAEAGAAANTIAAYSTDLRLASEVLGGGLGGAGRLDLEKLAGEWQALA